MRFFLRNSRGSSPISRAMSSIMHSTAKLHWGMPYPRMAPGAGRLVYTVRATEWWPSWSKYSCRKPVTALATMEWPWEA